jgi:hypothetical protein
MDRPDVTIGYVIERYVLHIFLAFAIYLIATAGFYWAIRKLNWSRMQGWWALVSPAVLAFIFISGREVFDVYHGDPVYKSFTDWSSWIVGLGLAIWGIYRLTPLFNDILIEIKMQHSRSLYEDEIVIEQDFSSDFLGYDIKAIREEDLPFDPNRLPNRGEEEDD